MNAKQTLNITILSCGGMQDLMSEQEAMFLNSALPLFRNVRDFGRATPRANSSLVRAYKPEHLLRALSTDDDILHLIAHADSSTLQVGTNHLKADTLAQKAKGGLRTPQVIVSTACNFGSQDWHDALRALGAKLLIGSVEEVSPANLAAFNMAFYSALLSRVRKKETTVDRAAAAFNVAEKYYRGIHAEGTPFAKFRLELL